MKFITLKMTLLTLSIRSVYLFFLYQNIKRYLNSYNNHDVILYFI